MTHHPAALKGLLLKLVGYQRAEFDVASQQQGWVLRTQFLAAVVAAATVFVKDEAWLYVLGILALVFVLASQFFQWKARVVRSIAEEIRRTVMVHHGLGSPLSNSEYVDLTGRSWCTEATASNMEDAQWYATKQPPAYPRMAEMLEESVHFSQQILARSARSTWFRLAFFLAVTLFILLLAIPFSSASSVLRDVQIACAGFTFLLSAEVLGAAFRYAQAAGDARLVASGLRQAREANFPADQVTLLLTNYNSAVESAPLFVPGLHTKVRDRLNKVFSGQKQGPSAQ
jgi:hypothetical protein